MASDNVLWFVALIFAVVCQYCGVTFSSVTLVNPTELTDVFVSHKCVQDLKYMSANCSTNNLRDVPQDLHPNVQKLTLANNPIDGLRNMSFVRYPLLIILDLDRCKITYIENGTFYPLRNLKKLVLTRAFSKNYTLNGELFRHSVDLQFVDIGHNELGAIPCAISHFPNLTSLRLDYNSLSSVNVACGKNAMDSIDLSNNKIESILPENFVFDCHTRSLTLDYNPVQMVDPGVIASIPVKSLSLSGYKLSVEVLRSLFVGISKSVFIQKLYLTNIGLGGAPGFQIPPDLFDPLCDKSLSVLDLRGNEFCLEEQIFFNLTYVSALYLTISGKIQPRYFDGMLGLRHLAIVAISLDLNPSHETWHINLTHLEVHVRIVAFYDVFLTEDTFKGLDSLTTLIIVNKEVSMSTVHLHLRLPSFQQLYLNVSTGEYNVTLDTPRLKVFLCGDDILGRLNCTFKILEGGKSLEEIHMSHALAVTSTNIFQELWNLTFLNISYNYIQLISPGSFFQFVFLRSA